MNPCFAIIDKNTLNNMALRSILWDIFNHVEVLTYNSIESFIRDSNRHFVHFFVNGDIIFNHIDEFEMLKGLTTVLVYGHDRRYEEAGFNVIDITTPENELAGKLLQLQQNGKIEGKNSESLNRIQDELSSREKDVLRLIVKGYINKEIADTLNISTTTVIFHRNNICEKLGTRSVGRLTIYAVIRGLIDVNEI